MAQKIDTFFSRNTRIRKEGSKDPVMIRICSYHEVANFWGKTWRKWRNEHFFFGAFFHTTCKGCQKMIDQRDRKCGGFEKLERLRKVGGIEAESSKGCCRLFEKLFPWEIQDGCAPARVYIRLYTRAPYWYSDLIYGVAGFAGATAQTSVGGTSITRGVATPDTIYHICIYKRGVMAATAVNLPTNPLSKPSLCVYLPIHIYIRKKYTSLFLLRSSLYILSLPPHTRVKSPQIRQTACPRQRRGI